MHIIDLRSDTITHPTPAMRVAMAAAEVGDDVFGDDPTVIRLEEMAAARVGKEAGLFVASGTMGNLVSLLAQCGRGDEVIVGDQAHTYINEQGGMAALGGIHPRVLRNQPDGTLDLDDIAGGGPRSRQHALPAHAADHRREYAKYLWRRAADSGVYERPREVGARWWPARPPGRRTDLQRGSRTWR